MERPVANHGDRLRVAVAASGGRDSTALLHATLRAAAPLGVAVHALHVHHGLSAQADAWLRHVQQQSRRWGATFHATRLASAPAPGDSVEAWARRERYAALARMAADAACDLVLLAHHRRDQAETVLLQALRGGGPAALAAMPVAAGRAGIVWARPWLAHPRAAIEAYVRAHRLRFVDDDGVDDARSRLRRVVWPALVAAFPAAEAQLHASALRAHEADAVLAEVGAADLAAVLDGDALDRAAWLRLSPPRRALALRRWLGGAPESLLRRLTLEMSGAADGARWPFGAVELRLHRGRLHAVGAEPVAAELTLDLSVPGPHPVPPWRGRFVVEPRAAGGVAPARLAHARIARRAGGERFQLAPRAAPPALKLQYQARAVAPWQRGGPLVWDGDALVYVPALGIDARLLAAAGAPQLGLRWEPDAAAASAA